jgi:hypothetical protein
MAWYYVKNGGTATGDGGRVTTQRTGAWSTTASEYYDTLGDADAATTAPEDGDFVLMSDLHTISYVGGFNLNSGGIASGDPLAIISVDDANQENYKPGAEETYTSSSIIPLHKMFMAGISLTCDTSLGLFQSTTTINSLRAIDCTFINNEAIAPKIMVTNASGTLYQFLNVDIQGYFEIDGYNKLEWFGGTLLSNLRSVLFDGPYDERGASIFFEGVDLSSYTGSLMAAAHVTNTDRLDIKLINCKLNSSLGLPALADLQYINHTSRMYGCDDTTGDELFNYRVQSGAGLVTNNNSKFTDSSLKWYAGSTQSSYEVITSTLCNPLHALVFELPIEYVDLSTSDILRVHLTTTLTLTDTDIAAYLVYPDSTTNVHPNWVTSGATIGTGNYGVDPLGAGTTLPVSTVSWTGALSNKYYLELDTTGDPGLAAPISIRIEVYRASIAATTLFIASEYEAI